MADSNDTVFGKIIRKEIPAEIVYETETVLAFKDITPRAPTHIIVIPKRYIPKLSDAVQSDRDVLGELMLSITSIVKQLNIPEDGFRVVINNGAKAGQTVFHLHLHLMAGRPFNWPPG